MPGRAKLGVEESVGFTAGSGCGWGRVGMSGVGMGMSGSSSRDGAMGGGRGELRSAPPYKKDQGEAPLIIRACERVRARASMYARGYKRLQKVIGRDFAG